MGQTGTKERIKRRRISSPQLSLQTRVLLGVFTFLVLFGGAFCSNEVRITDVWDFINFSHNVTLGTHHEGTTVYLDSDITFSDISLEYYFQIYDFRGIFDGQGHVISNLKFVSPYQFTGLFARSSGQTIQNLVLDDSCSVLSTFTTGNYDAVTAAIVGYCHTEDGPCVVLNSVNMGSVTYTGKTESASYTAGIVGAHLSENNFDTVVRNCVNFGTITDTGISMYYTHDGGIVGSSMKMELGSVYVQNCINYGTIFYNGSTYDYRIGSISGHGYFSIVENCVDAGTYIIVAKSNKDTHIGRIIGIPRYSTTINCYWNAEREHDGLEYEEYEPSITGSTSYNPNTLELTDSVSIGNYTGTSLIDALNAGADYYALRGYSHWASNKDKLNVSFTINNRRKPFLTNNAKVLILLDLAGESTVAFDRWYTDSMFTKPLADSSINGTDETDLYGLWKKNTDTNNYTIFFDTRGGSEVPPITLPFKTVVALTTNVTKERYEFVMWETEKGDPIFASLTVPAHNVTLYAVWYCTRITTAKEFIEFSRTVNSGICFWREPIRLESDLDFGEEEDGEDLSLLFEPNGINNFNSLRSPFDGQGHVIRNLKINSTFQFVGLFGYTTTIAIQNLVFDGSCSVVSTFNSDVYDAYTGSILGYCSTDDGPCTIENSVNMADVTFAGNTAQASYIGGITGFFDLARNNYILIKSCVNYGTVKNAGTSGTGAYIGGIVGSVYRRLTSRVKVPSLQVQNCVNHGTLIFDGTTNETRIGGISGYSYYCNNIENCVGSGKVVISSSSLITGDSFIGGVAGHVENSTVINCFWTRDVGFNDPIEYMDGLTKTTNILSVGQFTERTLSDLNDNVNSKNEFDRWMMLHLNGGRINNLTQDALVVLQKRFPDPVKEGNTFVQWCTDNECNGVFDPSKGLTSITEIYAAWLPNNYTVIFDLGNGTTIEEVFTFNSQINYPKNVEKEGHTLNGWNNDVITMPAENITIAALWLPNNYTVFFDLGNGTKIKEVFSFNSQIIYPENVEKDGCTFNGWNNNVITMPAKDITITVSWNCTYSSSSSRFLPVDGDKSSKSNTGAIVGGVVGGIAFIALVVIAVILFVLFGKRGDDDDRALSRNSKDIEMDLNGARESRQLMRRMAQPQDSEEGTGEEAAATASKYTGLYPERYIVPTIPDALKSIGLRASKAMNVVEACAAAGDYAEREGKLPEGFTKEDAAAVALYTFDFGSGAFELNPYWIVNRALASKDEAELRRASGLLFVVMSSLRKLPRATGKTLYRGMNDNIDRGMYRKGRTVVWHGLSSTSPDMNVTKAFLAKDSESGNAKGTLFIIEDGWGYDIQPYSLFPDEAEILLEPEREFKVQDVFDADLTIVKLKMADTPIILPEIFGDNQS